MVTVLSARGGCGATTIAINFAEEARMATNSTALLVDLDRHYGSMGAYLGLTTKYGLRDLLSHSGHFDDHLVRSTTAHYSEELHVLLGPASIEQTATVDLPLERLEAALAACRRAYPLTVVDAPRVPIGVAAELALASQLTLVVFELSVVDIRGARALLVALNDRRVAPGSILAVANRFRKRNPMLSLEDAEKALVGWNVVPVSNDYPNALKSINLGQPLSQTAPRSELRRDIQALAARIETQSSAVAKKGGVTR
jgi:pilus assembly protein CpaE